MHKVGISCLLVLCAKAQLTLPLIERPFLEAPPLSAKAFRLPGERWALSLQVQLEPWLDYAFDSTFTLRLRLYSEKTLVAETLLTTQACNVWTGSFIWSFEAVGGKFYFLEASAAEAERLSHVCRLWLPPHVVQRWIAAPDGWLPPVVAVYTSEGERDTLSLASPRWQSVFRPARIDTSAPLPPHVQKKGRSAFISTRCAWYVEGDSSQVFWSCVQGILPYASGTSRWAWHPERAKRASLLFAGHQPGARTDQGLLYIFLGPPALRLLDLEREAWVYPDLSAAFNFTWNGRRWQLQRRLEYQSLWQRK